MRRDHATAAKEFDAQVVASPAGGLAADGQAMLGESLFQTGAHAEAAKALAAALKAADKLSSDELRGLVLMLPRPLPSLLLRGAIEDRSSTALALTLGDLREQAGALELTLFGPSGQVYGTANEDPTKLVADQPDREVLQGVRNGKNFVALEVNQGNELVVRTLVSDPRGRPLTLQAIFTTSDLLWPV
jgi:hypothetical protein